MPQADPSRRAEARDENSADPMAGAVTIGDAAAISMEMAFVRRRMDELRIEQADLEAALATLEKQLSALEPARRRHTLR